MLCSQLHLVKYADDYRDIKPLPCRSWGCDHCAPRRRAQLMAQAASGEPNRCLTLTITTRIGLSPADRYRRLHDAFRILVKRINRQFALPPQRRWIMHTDEGAPYQDIRNYQLTKGIAQGVYTRLNYFAFVEATQAGEPHLHILIRSPYLPQNWIADVMAELIQSPRVWIDYIKNTKAAIGYVSKYVTKAPAQFGKTRRYWHSRKWEINKPDRPDYDPSQYQGATLVVQRWREVLEEIDRKRYIVIPQKDGWIRLHSLRSLRKEYPEYEKGEYVPDIMKAHLSTSQYAYSK